MPEIITSEHIARAKKNDRRAQNEIYHAFSKKMYAVCLRYFARHDEAQDCLQEAFITVFTKLSQYMAQGSFEGWIRRIIVNCCLQKLRQQRTIPLFDDVTLIADPTDESSEAVTPLVEAEQLMLLLEKMPPQYKMVFNLYVIDEFSHQEIANTLHISIGTSKSNYSRAKQWIKQQLIYSS